MSSIPTGPGPTIHPIASVPAPADPIASGSGARGGGPFDAALGTPSGGTRPPPPGMADPDPDDDDDADVDAGTGSSSGSTAGPVTPTDPEPGFLGREISGKTVGAFALVGLICLLLGAVGILAYDRASAGPVPLEGVRLLAFGPEECNETGNACPGRVVMSEDPATGQIVGCEVIMGVGQRVPCPAKAVPDDCDPRRYWCEGAVYQTRDPESGRLLSVEVWDEANHRPVLYQDWVRGQLKI
ncbi:MAG: hypothetical protein V1821_00840 [bacterium]